MPTVNIERLRKLDYRCNEAYKTLRTNIQLCGSDMKVIMFTSSTPNEGKSSVSFNLAVSLAESGKKVIFIDADLRKSVLVGRYKINKAIKGLTHFLSGMNKFEEVICTTNVDNLYVVFSGIVPPNPSELLANNSFDALVKALRDTYDYVIIDAPSGIDDGLVLSAAGTDEAIIVTMPEYSALRDADTLDRELLKLGIKNRYVVLNKVIAEMMSSGYAPRLREITTILRPPLAGAIQFDENIQISTNLGVPIVLKDGTYIQENFDKITDRILNA